MIFVWLIYQVDLLRKSFDMVVTGTDLFAGRMVRASAGVGGVRQEPDGMP